MAGADCTIPEGWEVHHEDEDKTNNSFVNLFCLHPEDHKKVHGKWNKWSESDAEFAGEDDIPF